MIELEADQLRISFPEVHPDALCAIEFQRTLRIPDDNRDHPLPPGLGRFPLAHVDDHTENLSEAWRKRGGVFLPMFQSEAMWVNFRSRYPFAIKIGAGKINAMTGDPWRNSLSTSPQDYLVIPEQPWLDGFCVAKGKIRQFVAMPLGSGFTAEEQLTGVGEYGGIQIIAYPMKASTYQELVAKRKMEEPAFLSDVSFFLSPTDPVPSMGLAPGGLMRQHIYEDPYGEDVWETMHRSRCFVHLMNSVVYRKATGQQPPHKPPTARDYTKAGLPWFEYYSETPALEGSAKLAGLDSVAAKGVKKGEALLPENEAVNTPNVIALGPKSKVVVRESDF